MMVQNISCPVLQVTHCSLHFPVFPLIRPTPEGQGGIEGRREAEEEEEDRSSSFWMQP